MDWNSAESQKIRFAQLMKVIEKGDGAFSIIDYGCGYGALIPLLHARDVDVEYQGFDLSSAMLESARQLFGAYPRTSFVDRADDLRRADYTVASGIFNVRLDVPEADWRKYVLETINDFCRLSARGFAFNMLTSYSDRDRMREDLYYADPGDYFDVCKRCARRVALLHDYPLYEFTLIVRCDD